MATSAAAVVAEDGDKRITHSTHYKGDGRDNAVVIKESRDEHETRVPSGERREKTKSGVQS